MEGFFIRGKGGRGERRLASGTGAAKEKTEAVLGEAKREKMGGGQGPLERKQ